MEKAEEFWQRMEDLGTSKFFGSKEEYLQEVIDWKSRDIPKKDSKQIEKDTLNYIDYCLDVLKGKKKFDFEEATKLHNKVKRWKPKIYPKKKNDTPSCKREV